MVDTMRRILKLHHIVAMSCYGTNLEEIIRNIGKQDEKYQQLKDNLH